jgi:hypothetical protein
MFDGKSDRNSEDHHTFSNFAMSKYEERDMSPVQFTPNEPDEYTRIWKHIEKLEGYPAPEKAGILA